jgi:hypothetical protein
VITRRLSNVTAAALCAIAVTLALADVSAAASNTPHCAPAKLRLTLATQATATQAVIFFSAFNTTRAACTLAGHIEFDVNQGRTLARVRNNPMRITVNVRLVPGRTRAVTHFWWGNWCGSNRDLSVNALYQRLKVRSRFNYLPACISSNTASSLSLP